MKQFSIDWEFAGRVEQPDTISDLDIKPISVGIVCDDGREYYAIFDRDHDSYGDPWLDEHVIAKLDPAFPRKTAEDIRKDVWEFVLDGNPDHVMIWSDQAGYDQILFHSLLSPVNMFCVRDFRGADKSRKIDFSLVRDFYESLGKPTDQDYFVKPDEAHVHIAIDDARAQMVGIKLMNDYLSRMTDGQVTNYSAYKKWMGEKLQELSGLGL